MSLLKRSWALAALWMLAACALGVSARANDTIKLGLSVPLSGAGAIWGKGGEWMCKKAAQEINEAGGVRVNDRAYDFECLAYDNKYNAAEGTRVAQTLLNRDGVKFIGCAIGTVPSEALQALAERQGVLMFHTSWGTNTKGPKHPFSFTVLNTPFEIMPAMVEYITRTYEQAKTIALLNANDASGRESESISHPIWDKAGIKVVASDFYERGTTEFQPIATRLLSFKPDIIDLSSVPPADAGRLFKELDVLGFKGVKITDNGTGIDALQATGGSAIEGVHMGAAMSLDGPDATERQRKPNEEARAYLGESLNIVDVGCYDAVYALKAAMEKARSVAPADVVTAMPTARFSTFYGGETGFGGKALYGSDQQMILPIFITRIENGKLVEKARIEAQAR
jgi:branched-chain amino acid transport system substrate-binding protein